MNASFTDSFPFAARLWRVCRTLLLFSGAGYGPTALGQLTIVPTYDDSVTSDVNSSAIISTINQAIQYYETSFSDPISINIKFEEATTGLGSSTWWYYSVPYSTFRDALQMDGKSPDDLSALATLPGGTISPVAGTPFIGVKTADIRALGIVGSYPSGLAGGFDGIIRLNTSLMNVGAGAANPTKYSLLALAEHEINEVLGMSSGLDLGAAPPVLPEDLFRYDSSGNRTFSSAGDDAHFSVDGGRDLLAQFNQDGREDHGDWASLGSHTPRVQDAFSTPGVSPSGELELVALDVIGYDRVTREVPAASAVPEPNSTGAVFGAACLVLVIVKRGRHRE